MSYTPQVFKIIPIIAALSTAFTALPVTAAPLQDDAKQAFEHAYQNFQQAQAGDKAAREQLQQLAYEALQKGKVYFGEAHFNTATLAVNYLMLLNPQERVGNEQYELAQRAASVYQSELPATDIQQLDPLMLAIETMPAAKTEKLAEYEAALNTLFDAWPKGQEASRVVIRSQVAEQFMRLGQLRSDMWQQVYRESETLNGMNHPLTLKAAYLSTLTSGKGQRLDAINTLERVVGAEVQGNSETRQIQLASHYALTKHYAALDRHEALTETIERIHELQASAGGTAAHERYYSVSPRYPSEAISDHQDGMAKLSFDIGKEGQTQNIQVLEQTTPGFGQAAKEALAKWRYVPAFDQGEPVATMGESVQLDFTLETMFR